MSRSALDFWAIVLAALPLALGACGTYPLYDGPERPIEETAVITDYADSDHIGLTGSLSAEIHSIDGRETRIEIKYGPFFSVMPGGARAVLPGVHTFYVTYNYSICGRGSPSPVAHPGSGGLVELILVLPVILVTCGPTAALWPDYGSGTRDIVAMLEAGKEYQFRVDGVDGEVFVWIEEEETGKVVGGESPTEIAQFIHVPKPPADDPPFSVAGALWNGKWFAKEGAWYLYLEAENGAFTGRALRTGRDFYRVAGTISPESLVTGASRMNGARQRAR